MSSISVKVTRETAHVLQNYYPERLGLAILYNPPKIFESFWTVCGLLLFFLCLDVTRVTACSILSNHSICMGPIFGDQDHM